MSKYCHTFCLIVCLVFFVHELKKKKSIFCTGYCTVVQKKSVSRICAPVKMQINLFVRSLCFVSALLGMDVCRRAMCCSHVVLSALQNQQERSLHSAGEGGLAIAKCPAAISSCWDWLHFSVIQCRNKIVYNL